jgi:glycosyltransferase involved in cell wall biosynthesis
MVMPYTFTSQSGNLAHSFSLGVPVVVSGLEGLKAAVEASGAGITVPPGDERELKRAILNIMEDDNLRHEYSERAERYVRTHISWKMTAQKHMKIYKKVIMGKKTAPRSLMCTALLEPDKP